MPATSLAGASQGSDTQRLTQTVDNESDTHRLYAQASYTFSEAPDTSLGASPHDYIGSVWHGTTDLDQVDGFSAFDSTPTVSHGYSSASLSDTADYWAAGGEFQDMVANSVSNSYGAGGSWSQCRAQMLKGAAAQ